MIEEFFISIETHSGTALLLIVALWIYGLCRNSSITIINKEKE